jgi:hypothetical protein
MNTNKHPKYNKEISAAQMAAKHDNVMIDLTRIDNVKVAGIDTHDYPDFCDAYIEAADYDGIPMSEKQLDELNNEHSEFVYESVMKQLY